MPDEETGGPLDGVVLGKYSYVLSLRHLVAGITIMHESLLGIEHKSTMGVGHESEMIITRENL